MWIVIILISIILLLSFELLRKSRENYGVLEAGNIPVLPPTLFMGSEPDHHKKILHFQDIEHFKTYGKIWGSYFGKTPEVRVADAELARKIFVKDVDHFYDRRDLEFGSHILNQVLDFLKGEKWKTIRGYLTPLFTASKINGLKQTIENSALEFIRDLESETVDGKLTFDCNLVTGWLIDMFTQAMLGFRVENGKDPSNKYSQAFREMIGEAAQFDFMYTLSLSFPILQVFAPAFNQEPLLLILSTFNQIMEERKFQIDETTNANGKRSEKDFINVLNELSAKGAAGEFKRLGIDDTTVIAQAINFFVAGYHTTGSALTHLLYHLAEHPKVQEKVYLEVTELLRQQGESGVASLKDSQLPYTLATINESLRLCPPVFRPERVCTKDWVDDATGISIRKGTNVVIAAWALHRNPEYYQDPEVFMPERFLPENSGALNPYAFTTFGLGPRNCIGIRFAYAAMRTFLCHLVKEFRVEMREDSALQYKTAAVINLQINGLFLDLVRREK